MVAIKKLREQRKREKGHDNYPSRVFLLFLAKIGCRNLSKRYIANNKMTNPGRDGC